jgi:hypothetical protein
MIGISVYDHTYKNHKALILSMDDRNSVYGHGFHRQEIHSQYKASLVVELIRRHGKCEITWSSGLCVHCYISDRLLVIIRRLANLNRNMTAKIYEELEAKLDDLDAFEATLAPYVIAEQLTPFGGSNWATISG